MKYVIGALLIIIIFIFIRGVFLERKKRLMLINTLKSSYGKNVKKKYSHGTGDRDVILKIFHNDSMIDDITWNDLDMERVFERIDSTNSSLGEQYLYYLLHEVSNCDASDEINEYAIAFSRNEDYRSKVQLLLCKIGFLRKTSLFEYLDYLNDNENSSYILDVFLDILFIPFIVLTVFFPLVGGALVYILIVINVLRYFSLKRDLEKHLSGISYISKIVKISKALFEAASASNSDYDWCTDIQKSLFSRDAAYYAKNKRIFDKIVANGAYLATSNAGGNSMSSSSGPLEVLLNYINMVFHIDLISYGILIKTISGNQEVFEKLAIILGKYDSSISIASFRKSLINGCSIPEFVDSAACLDVEDIYHPLINSPITNSISTNKSVLLTGSNASGKSTFLRTIAINSILAQSIETVCAKTYKAPRFNIYSSIALSDNLLNNESYFIVEIKSLKRILDASLFDKPVICFIDEVLRGTNTSERISASKVILEELAARNVLCFAATHDGILAEKLDGVYTNMHFEEQIINNDVLFDYKLKIGKATSRNALALLKAYGYPENIVNMAENMAHNLDTN